MGGCVNWMIYKVGMKAFSMLVLLKGCSFPDMM